MTAGPPRPVSRLPAARMRLPERGHGGAAPAPPAAAVLAGTGGPGDPVTAGERAAVPRRLVSRAYARLWSGQAVSAAGDAAFTVSAVLWADRLSAGQPWAAAAVSGVPAAAYAAIALAGPLAGAVVDRFDRRTVMALTELARAGLAGGLAAASFVPRLPVGARLLALYLAIIALNAAGQLFVPARIAMTAFIVPRASDRVRAAGLSETATSAAGALGPLAAGPLTLAAGIHWALIADAVSYLASWWSVRSLPSCRPARPDAGARAGLLEGLAAFAASRWLTVLLSVTVISQVGAGALTALNVLAVQVDLHGSPGAYGLAEAVMGVGYVAGAAFAGRLVRAAGVRTVVCGGLLAAGAFTGGYSLARSVPAGLVLLGGYAIAIALLNTSVLPGLMASAPGEVLGRVMVVFSVVNQAVAGAAVLACGWLADGALRGFRAGDGIGPVSLLLLIGACLMTAAAIRAAVALPPAPAAGPAQAKSEA